MAGAASIAMARRGLERAPVHAEVLEGTMVAHPTRPLRMPDGDCAHVAPEAGPFEPLAKPGARVVAAAPLARIGAPDRTGAAPVTATARREGLFVTRHAPGLIRLADCLAVLAVPEG